MNASIHSARQDTLPLKVCCTLYEFSGMVRWCCWWWFSRQLLVMLLHACSYIMLKCIATKRLILHLRLDKNEIIYIHLCYDMISYLSHHIIFIIIFRRIIWTVTCEFKYVILLDTYYAPQYARSNAASTQRASIMLCALRTLCARLQLRFSQTHQASDT